MNVAVLSKIEENIYQLPVDEQLWLIERLVQRMRNKVVEQSNLNSQLIAMANDSEIRRELQVIDAEFAIAEADGLETA